MAVHCLEIAFGYGWRHGEVVGSPRRFLRKLVPGGIPDIVCGCLVDLVYGDYSQRFQLFAS